jgi:NDP-sugar pyrophosphorylase family protein
LESSAGNWVKIFWSQCANSECGVHPWHTVLANGQAGKVTDIKAVLLVGGLGMRLRSVVPSAPKALAPVGDRPFLELLIRQLLKQGIRRLVMCTGYLADQIEVEFGDGRDIGVAIEYSKETQPLGTAGAVKLAQPHLQSVSEFLVMNGDSFLELDFSLLVDFHRAHGGLATVAVVAVENAGRYGTVHADSSNKVTAFCEKTGDDAPGLINAGVYVFSGAILGQIPDGPSSLEKDVFPRILDQGVFAAVQRGMFIDIGTPGDYTRAQVLLHRLYRATTNHAEGTQT